jgi:hypothetical protein
MQQKWELTARCDFQKPAPASLLLNMAYDCRDFHLKIKRKCTSADIWVTAASKPIVKYSFLMVKMGVMRAILLLFL